eukprot:5502159-Ditylum_brightwellii.AAC.1
MEENEGLKEVSNRKHESLIDKEQVVSNLSHEVTTLKGMVVALSKEKESLMEENEGLKEASNRKHETLIDKEHEVSNLSHE